MTFHTEHLLMASAAVLVWGAVAIKGSPLLRMQRALVNLRAVGKLFGYGMRAFWAERRRWRQCVEEAKREW